MAKFNFRLQNLLQVKEKMEETKKGEYGKALKKIEEEKQIKNVLYAQDISIKDEFRTYMKQGISPDKACSYRNYILFLKKKLLQQEHNIRNAEIYADIKREELLTIMKEKKALEVLKEKKYVLYREEEVRIEQQYVDEMVSFKYANHHE